MNNYMKKGLTFAVAGVVALTSVAAFADTATTSNTSKTPVRSHVSATDLMVKDGVITQATLDSYMAKAQSQNQAQREADVKAAVQKLVTDGKLTQAKADAVLKSVAENQDKMQALREKMSTMTAEEARTYMQNNMPKGDTLLTLVESGTLTSAEYQSVKSVIGFGHNGFGMGHGDKMMGGHGQGKGFGRGEAPATTSK